MLKFNCTDRLKETKILEKNLEIDTISGSEYNKVLIEKLKEFQGEVNSLLSEFVEKEKKAISSKQLSNDHLKVLTKSTNEESGTSSCSETESENEEGLKKIKNNSPTDPSEPAEKKPCIEN